MGRRTAVAMGLALLVLVGLYAWLRSLPSEEAPQAETAARGTDVAAAAPAGAGAAPEPEPAEPPPFDPEDARGAWAQVDFDEIRAALPDNSYWRNAVPTKDERVLAEREAESARWNDEYGKVLSGTATEEEILAYYAHRQEVSSDYVEFVTYVIEHYGDDLPERDLRLLHLARKLHMARLEEIPRRTEEAFERKRSQDAAREAWLRDEALFDANDDQGEP